MAIEICNGPSFQEGETPKVPVAVPLNCFEHAVVFAADLKGCKKVKSLASRNLGAVLDLCTCSAEEAEGLDVASMLRHHAIPAGSPGSYSHRFHEMSVLGQGSFGSVAHVRSLLDGGEFAVKSTAEGRALTDSDVKRVLLEGQLLRHLAADGGCESTLQFYGMWIESMMFKNQMHYRIYLQMELCSCSLRTMQVNNYRFAEAEIVAVINGVRTRTPCDMRDPSMSHRIPAILCSDRCVCRLGAFSS
jgi:hypothetical protein